MILATNEPPPDGSAIVLILAAIGLWYILIGFAHFLLWAAWKVGVRFPEWMAEHLADEWGQR